MTTTEQIRLSLPAQDEYGRLARIAAAGLALRLGFTYQEIQDLRLAIDEALIYLLRADEDGVITVVFDPTGDTVAISASTTVATPPQSEARERIETLVGPIVDRLTVDDDGKHIEMLVHHGDGSGPA